jgi:VWFA-related protein
MMRPLYSIVPVLLCGVAIPFCGAQAADSTPAQPIPVLHMTSNLVLVDVVVTDHGKAVHGLDRGKFHLFEDGQEQAIGAFEEHQPAAVPSALPVPPKLPPHTYNNVPLYPDTGVFNVLLLDGLNTPETDQMRTRQQMIEYMGKIQPGTMLAVFTLSSRLQMVTGFTTDVAQLTKTVKGQKSENPTLLAGATAPDPMDQLFDKLQPGGPAAAAMAAFEADVAEQELEQRVRITLAALKQLGLYLNAIPGRKNLIWFTGSLPAALDPYGSLASSAQEIPGYTDDVRRTNDLLTAARVAVYPVDARGIMNFRPFDASNPTAGPMHGIRNGILDQAPANAAFTNQLIAEQTAMRQIAEQTGGQAFINTNGLKEAVASAVENGSSYYTLAYTPPTKKFDRQFHKIEVRLDVSGDQLSYRRGFYADAPEKSAAHAPGTISPFIASTVHGAPPATQILFLTRVLAAGDPQLKGAKLSEAPAGEMTASLKGPAHRYVVDLQIDPRTVAFEKTPDGLHRATLECTLVAYDGDGKRLNYTDGGNQIDLNADQYAKVLARGLPVRLEIDLPAGQDFLRIAIHDETADHAGSLEIPLTVAGS